MAGKGNDELMAHIMDKLNKIEDKLDRKFDAVESRIDSIDKTLVKQEENLKEHMRRTDLAEKAIERVDSDLKPIKKHVDMLQGVVKFVTLIGVIVGIIGGVLKIYGIL